MKLCIKMNLVVSVGYQDNQFYIGACLHLVGRIFAMDNHIVFLYSSNKHIPPFLIDPTSMGILFVISYIFSPMTADKPSFSLILISHESEPLHKLRLLLLQTPY